MNKRIYGLAWNRAIHQVVVASELAKCKRGSPSGSGRLPARRKLLAAALLLACAAPLSLLAGAG